MGEIADDHYVQLSWEEGTGIGQYTTADMVGPMDNPNFGGINAWILRHTTVSSYSPFSRMIKPDTPPGSADQLELPF